MLETGDLDEKRRYKLEANELLQVQEQDALQEEQQDGELILVGCEEGWPIVIIDQQEDMD